MAITVLSFAGAIGIASCQSVGAVAIDAAAMKEAASAAWTVQQVRFYGPQGTTSSSATANSPSARMCATVSIVGDGNLRSALFGRGRPALTPNVDVAFQVKSNHKEIRR
jgi:hypothetical protein